MSALDRRIATLEEELALTQHERIFIHRSFVCPGNGQIEPLGYKARLLDGQELMSNPGETVEEFQERIAETDTMAKAGYGYRIIDEIR